MPTPDKAALATSYRQTISDMQQELTGASRVWSQLIHSPVGKVGTLVGAIIFRPRSLLFGGSLAAATLAGIYLTAWLYDTPFNTTEPLLAFLFGWVIGLLYDLFFVATRRHLR